MTEIDKFHHPDTQGDSNRGKRTKFFYPEPQRFSLRDYPGEEPSKIQAEITYRQIYDFKSAQVTKVGANLCKMIKIDPESIIHRKLDYFEASYPDAEIAELHFKHHSNRR